MIKDCNEQQNRLYKKNKQTKNSHTDISDSQSFFLNI